MTTVEAKPGGREIQQIDSTSFRHLSKIIHEESGIVLPDGKRNLVASRLARRLRELNLADFTQYCRLLDSAPGTEERVTLVSLLTTNVTRFFREDHHFTALRDSILPPLVKSARAGGRVRIWSAGCSTGEEPFSIAMCVLGACPDAAELDIRILGTDIDQNVIKTASAAEYANIDEKHLPKTMRDRHLDPVEGTPGRYRMKDGVRRLVTFNQLNLLRDWPMRGQFDVIFCRNVVIYFDAPTQAGLWRRFASYLHPGGHLMLGHSERVDLAAEPRLKPSGVTQYRRAATDA